MMNMLYEFIDFLIENFLVVTLVFMGLFLCVNRRNGLSFMRTEHCDTNYCNDENCVRCNKYHDTAIKALNKVSSINNQIISFKIQKGLDFVYRPTETGFKQKPNVFYYDNLQARNIWDKQFKRRLADCLLIEKSFKTIKTEMEFLLENPDLGTWKKNRTHNGSWDVFHLINQGSTVPENQTLCPQTLTVINSLTSVMKGNVFGNVMISVLKPGTVITPHYGPTNIRLRCHLGLQVTSDCFLTVDGQKLTWENGKCLVFDDSFLHSVKHTDQTSDITYKNKWSEPNDRVVLIVDLWHPDLSAEERETINMCFHP
ncbi:aspartate beta-hydroxylase domain-containing protein 2-like [Mercenaria mercenaria]|uniref:aspartate beta-hydroxylase domain-containing protein 2-like n=1 Tax=Mercenaria mercenaria TaxID=6596 RepID=UPI00234F322A|nr:aspartate beta-hydroxylase domain-containing protein 2-like [Mercenaria mercenaria]